MEGSSRMCVRKAFTLTLFLAGNPVGKTPSCLCVQIPEAGTAGGAEAGALSGLGAIVGRKRSCFIMIRKKQSAPARPLIVAAGVKRRTSGFRAERT